MLAGVEVLESKAVKDQIIIRKFRYWKPTDLFLKFCF